MFVQKFQGLFYCAHPHQLLIHAAKCSAVAAALQANQTPEDDRNKINIPLWYQKNTGMVKDSSSIQYAAIENKLFSKLFCRLPVLEKMWLRNKVLSTKSLKCFCTDNMTSILKCERAHVYFLYEGQKRKTIPTNSWEEQKSAGKRVLEYLEIGSFPILREDTTSKLTPLSCCLSTLILDIKGKLAFLLSHC